MQKHTFTPLLKQASLFTKKSYLVFEGIQHFSLISLYLFYFISFYFFIILGFSHILNSSYEILSILNNKHYLQQSVFLNKIKQIHILEDLIKPLNLTQNRILMRFDKMPCTWIPHLIKVIPNILLKTSTFFKSLFN